MPLEIRNLLNSCHDLKFTDLPYLCNRTPGDNHRLGVARFIGDILNFNTITQMHAVMQYALLRCYKRKGLISPKTPQPLFRELLHFHPSPRPRALTAPQATVHEGRLG